MKTFKTDVCIIGAGAGGTGCAYRLIKNGVKTVVVDKNPDFGGTAVFSGIDGWEPGVTLDGIHDLIRKNLEKRKNACHVIEGVANCNLFYPENKHNLEGDSFERYPWSLAADMGKKYEDTLDLYLHLKNKLPLERFQFEYEEMSKAINEVMNPYKDNLTAFFGYSFYDCKTNDGKVISVDISNGEEKIRIEAKYFVDSSGDIVLARKAGCGYSFGTDDKNDYNEPSCGERTDSVNGVSYIFRLRKTDDENYIDEIPEKYLNADIEKWKNEKMKKVISCFFLYPNGDINVNMLPTMEGREYFHYGENADYIGQARVYAYWNYLQKNKNMKGYKLIKIFDAGIRESYRLKGKYVFTENDIRQAEHKKQTIGRTIAIADHTLDIHGENGLARLLYHYYEIPLECAMTNEFENLFVACRGASFSHIASSSVRLTRTMLSMGEGVGEYISELF